MSKQQRETIEQMLRQGELDFGGEVDEQRRLFADLLSAIPLPADVRTEKVAELLGLASANVVNVYRGRYQDFPAPVLTRRGFAFGYAAMWRPGPETQVGPTRACEATPAMTHRKPIGGLSPRP